MIDIYRRTTLAFPFVFFSLPETLVFFLAASRACLEHNHDKDDARVTPNADGDRDRRRPAAGVVHTTRAGRDDIHPERRRVRGTPVDLNFLGL